MLRCTSDRVDEHVSTPDSGIYKYSYSMNEQLENSIANPYWPNMASSRIRITMIKDPADKILLAEEDERTINDGLWARPDAPQSGGRDLLSIRHDSNNATNPTRTPSRSWVPRTRTVAATSRSATATPSTSAASGHTRRFTRIPLSANELLIVRGSPLV